MTDYIVDIETLAKTATPPDRWVLKEEDGEVFISVYGSPTALPEAIELPNPDDIRLIHALVTRREALVARLAWANRIAAAADNALLGALIPLLRDASVPGADTVALRPSECAALLRVLEAATEESPGG